MRCSSLVRIGQARHMVPKSLPYFSMWGARPDVSCNCFESVVMSKLAHDHGVCKPFGWGTPFDNTRVGERLQALVETIF